MERSQLGAVQWVGGGRGLAAFPNMDGSGVETYSDAAGMWTMGEVDAIAAERPPMASRRPSMGTGAGRRQVTSEGRRTAEQPRGRSKDAVATNRARMERESPQSGMSSPPRMQATTGRRAIRTTWGRVLDRTPG